jgi:hypothetical protein
MTPLLGSLNKVRASRGDLEEGEAVDIFQHRDDEPALRVHGDTDIHLVDDLVGPVGEQRVEGGVFLQGQRARLDHKVLDGRPDRAFFNPEFEQRRGIHVTVKRDVYCFSIALPEALGNDAPQ